MKSSIAVHHLEKLQDLGLVRKKGTPSVYTLMFGLIATIIFWVETFARAISFRIPELPSSNGTWKVISVVEVAGETAWDTLTFQVYCLIPVGGYSFPIDGYTKEKSLPLYLALLVILTAVFTITKRKII